MYTHTYEFIISGINTQGEISFDGNSPPKFKTTTGEELTIKQHGAIQRLFEGFVSCHKALGSIEKIEVVKK